MTVSDRDPVSTADGSNPRLSPQAKTGQVSPERETCPQDNVIDPTQESVLPTKPIFRSSEGEEVSGNDEPLDEETAGADVPEVIDAGGPVIGDRTEIRTRSQLALIAAVGFTVISMSYLVVLLFGDVPDDDVGGLSIILVSFAAVIGLVYRHYFGNGGRRDGEE